MIYTGIGSRQTPKDVLRILYYIGDRLAQHNWILRTGGAEGADMEFWHGAVFHGYANAEVYLPWKSFNGWGNSSDKVTRTEPQEEAYGIAEQFHPGWKYLKFGAKKLHARNVHQIYGRDVTKPEFSDCVICWTKGGKGEGGTGQALRMARHHEIPIYDLGNPLTWQIFSDIISL
jgi:hypothetical protein